MECRPIGRTQSAMSRRWHAHPLPTPDQEPTTRGDADDAVPDPRHCQSHPDLDAPPARLHRPCQGVCLQTPRPPLTKNDFLSAQFVEAFAYAAPPLPPKKNKIPPDQKTHPNIKARVVQLTGVERHRLRCFCARTWSELADHTSLWGNDTRQEDLLLKHQQQQQERQQQQPQRQQQQQ